MDIKEIRLKTSEAEKKISEILLNLANETQANIRNVNVSIVYEIAKNIPVNFIIEIQAKL